MTARATRPWVVARLQADAVRGGPVESVQYVGVQRIGDRSIGERHVLEALAEVDGPGVRAGLLRRPIGGGMALGALAGPDERRGLGRGTVAAEPVGAPSIRSAVSPCPSCKAARLSSQADSRSTWGPSARGRTRSPASPARPVSIRSRAKSLRAPAGVSTDRSTERSRISSRSRNSRSDPGSAA